MRLITLALAVAAALVLALPANAARPRPPATTTQFTGTPVFVSTPFAADPSYRDVTLTAPFSHAGSVVVQYTITFNGATSDLMTSRIFRGTGSDTFRSSIPGNDCLAPEPGDTVSYHLQLVSVPKGVALAEITTSTFHIT